jgi:class 3 adenylate cyclase
MAEALATHDAIVSETLTAHGGSVFKRVGDAFCSVFRVARSIFDSVFFTRTLL